MANANASASTTGNQLKNRLSRRMFALFVGCAIVPLIALAVGGYVYISSTLMSSASSSLSRSCKATGMTIAERLRFLEADLKALSARLGWRSKTNLGEAVDENRQRLDERFEGISLLDRKLNSLGGSGAEIKISPLTEHEREHLQAGKTVVRTVSGDSAFANVLMIQRTYLVKSNMQVLLVGLVRSDYLWGGDGMTMGDAELLVLAPDHQMVFSTRPEVPVSPDIVTAGEWSDGEEKYLASSRTLFLIPRFLLKWQLVYSRAKSAVLEPLTGFRQLFVLVCTLAFLLVVLLSNWLIRKRLGPVTELVAATKAIAKQDFDVRLGIRSGDEFQELGRVFDLMIDELAKHRAARDQVELELVEARDRALDSAKTEQEFVTNVSHELRTPMTSIRAFAEILASGEEDEETRQEFLDIIVAESERLTRLIEDVLSFSRLNSDSVEPKLERILLSRNVERCCASTRGFADARGVKIVFGNEGRAVVEGDRDRLTQVWMNLISNAVKFTPEHGQVEVTVRCSGDHGIVEVRDEGPGIPHGEQQAIFERFRQVYDDQMTHKPAGTGLGLTIAKEILDQHDAEIEVESEHGQGAVFRVKLPLAKKASATVDSPPTSSTP